MEVTEEEALRGPPLVDGCAVGDGAEVGRAEGALALLNDGEGLSTRVDVSDHGVHEEVRPAELLVLLPRLSILHFTFSFASKVK